MIQVRSFKPEGLQRVKQHLDELREGKQGLGLEEMLRDSSLVTTPYTGVFVEQRAFHRRREAADYFHECFADIPSNTLRHDAGFWTWLTIFYFDQVCPTVDGERKVRNDYTYIFMPGRALYFYRHLLFISWYVRFVAPAYNRLFLEKSVNSLDKLTEDVMKRLYLTRIPCIFEVLDRLYWDRERGRPRRGVMTPGKVVPGDLIHRLPIRIRQLEKTYDLQILSADQLIELLGDEFKHHLTKQLELPEL